MEDRVHDVWLMIKEVLIGVLPLAGLIAATLGTILIGAATPTEAAGIGALGAMLLAIAYRKATLAGLKRACLSTMATSSMVLFLAVTSNIFGAVFARMGTANWITEVMLALPLGPVVMLAVVVVLIFLLGWPFEWPAIVLVFLPIFYPVMEALKPALSVSLDIPVDMVMVWFGALVAVVLQTAFLSPPVAMSAYYLRQVVKEWSLATIYKGMFEFMMIQCLAIVLIIAFPKIATWFPLELQENRRNEVHERVEDNAESLERDTVENMQQQSQESTDALEKSEEAKPPAAGDAAKASKQ
jgi:TRAP-type mannitol/chloroaromatic compound transport system permease large subunit